jgi:hypothetical protein
VANAARFDAICKEMEAAGFMERVGIRRGQIAWRLTPEGMGWAKSMGHGDE